MNSPEKLTTFGTQDEDTQRKKKHNTIQVRCLILIAFRKSGTFVVRNNITRKVVPLNRNTRNINS